MKNKGNQSEQINICCNTLNICLKQSVKRENKMVQWRVVGSRFLHLSEAM